MSDEKITVKKKKKLTIKKDIEPPEGASEDSGPIAADSRLANPLDQVEATVDTGSQTWAVFVAIAAVICCLGLLIVQWLEWSKFHEPPTAFPRVTPAMPVATASAPEPAPEVEPVAE